MHNLHLLVVVTHLHQLLMLIKLMKSREFFMSPTKTPNIPFTQLLEPQNCEQDLQITNFNASYE